MTKPMPAGPVRLTFLADRFGTSADAARRMLATNTPFLNGRLTEDEQAQADRGPPTVSQPS